MIGLVAMVGLGLLVGPGSTGFDDRFGSQLAGVVGPRPRWLLAFTDPRLVVAVLAGCLAISVYRRRWALAVAVLSCPVLAAVGNGWLKGLFDRRNGPYLEYPSGHTTALVVALSLLVLAVGAARRWAAVAAAVPLGVLGALGLVGCGYHYLTDTIGAALFGTALVAGAARLTSAL